MLVVNLFGGPGTGKSTLAAALFSNLKIKGVNAELVTEFAKDLVWSERNKELQDQVYILGKMYHKLWRLKDKVDVVVIDSPLPLCVYYDQGKTPGMDEFVMGLFNQFRNINILLERNFPYQQEGRYQDEEGAVNVHNDIRKLLDTTHVNYAKCHSPEVTVSSTQYAILVDNIAGTVIANLL